jgi:error-prone DNA polymerase
MRCGQVKAIRADTPLPLFNDPIDGEVINEPTVTLPVLNLGEAVVENYVAMRLSLCAHPVELIRTSLSNITPHAELPHLPLGRVTVCGLVITRQRPGTTSGVVFLMLLFGFHLIKNTVAFTRCTKGRDAFASSFPSIEV